jgi:hypothetical protein
MKESATGYIAYDQLGSLLKSLQAKVFDWTSLAEQLRASPKDEFSHETFYLLSKEDGKVYIETNNCNKTLPEETEDNSPAKHWFFLELYDDRADPEVKINPQVQEIFADNIETFKTLPGVSMAMLHRIAPNSFTFRHTDYEDGQFYSIILIISAPAAKPGEIVLVTNTRTDVACGDIFKFNAAAEHSAENFTNDDVFLLSMRVLPEYFNDRF